MNKIQRLLLALGLLGVAVMGLFPPWIQRLDYESIHLQRPGSYEFIATPPQASMGNNWRLASVSVDTGRLVVGWVIIVAATTALLLLFRTSSNKMSGASDHGNADPEHGESRRHQSRPGDALNKESGSPTGGETRRSIDELPAEKLDALLSLGGDQYRKIPEWPAWRDQMLAMLGPRVGPYLADAYNTIHAVAIEDKKNTGEPEESAEKPEPATRNTDGARKDQSEQKNPPPPPGQDKWKPLGKNPWHAGNPGPFMDLPKKPKPKPPVAGPF